VGSNEPPVDGLKSFAEVVGKLSLGALGVCYALGLIVLNVHFSRYGVYSLSLFQVNYITAGIWALLPVVAPWVLGLFSLWVLLHFRWKFTKRFYRYFSLPLELRPERERAKQQGSILMWVGLAACFPVLMWRSGIDFRPWLGVLAVGAVWGFLLVLMTLIALDRKKQRKKPVIMLVAVTVTLALVIYATIFGGEAYGTIPAHLGGGAPGQVYFIVEPDVNVKTFFKNMGIHFQGESNRTEAVRLLLVTEGEYIILTPEASEAGGRALSIRRDYVKALLFEGARR
jgi:hypothetical protein